MSDDDKQAVRFLVSDIEGLALEHCDEDASFHDESPNDMVAHRNGLIVQLCRRAIELLK